MPGRERSRLTAPFPAPTISTFVIRFWQEWSAAGSRWRGRIEHIPSGRSTAFLYEEVMWQFIQSFGIMVNPSNEHEMENPIARK
jgi:uncharacterized lipoprotein YajG